jgi:hypothetical protein
MFCRYTHGISTRSSAKCHALRLLVLSILPIALILIYYDQRILPEGFDIEGMMLQAEMEAAEVNAPVLGRSPQSNMASAPVKETQG